MVELISNGKGSLLIHLTSVVISRMILLVSTVNVLKIRHIYPRDTTIGETTKSEAEGPYLDLRFIRDKDDKLVTSFMGSMTCVSILFTFHSCLGIFPPAHDMMSTFRST